MANFTTDGKICIERELNVTISEEKINEPNLIHRFDIAETCKWITDNNYSKVCLQFPDHLLTVSASIYEEIKKRADVDIYILGDTSYASCCVDSVAAMHVEADAVIHYGHTCFSKTNIPTYIVLPKRDLHIDYVLNILQNKFSSDDSTQLCLFYDAEFEYCKDILAQQWYKKYPHSYIAFIEQGDDNQDKFQGRAIHDVNGQTQQLNVLENCICLYIGARSQTLFNYTVSVAAKEWYLLDPDTNTVDHIEETAWFKRRRYLIEKCKDAAVIGILVCKLVGEQTQGIISRVKQLCRVNCKKSYIISVGKPNVAKLANFPEIDVYVMIACPENDLYSNKDFYKPIVYPYELEVALNSNREPYFTTHITDYDELLPGKRHYCNIEQVTQETDVSLITGKIRENKLNTCDVNNSQLAEKEEWALENIGRNLQDRSWKGLEQKLGETEVKKAEEGRKGIPLQYSNEPE